MHERVHEEGSEMRAGVRIERGVSLRSLRLGLIGKADVVEFHRREDGIWRPFPVEYKRGRPKPDRCDEVQLCAQALCLEEMLDARIPDYRELRDLDGKRLFLPSEPRLYPKREVLDWRLARLRESGWTPTAQQLFDEGSGP